MSDKIIVKDGDQVDIIDVDSLLTALISLLAPEMQGQIFAQARQVQAAKPKEPALTVTLQRVALAGVIPPKKD